MAAVRPAGPEPMIMTLRISLFISSLMSVVPVMCGLLSVIAISELCIDMDHCLIQVLKWIGICNRGKGISIGLLCDDTPCRHISPGGDLYPDNLSAWLKHDAITHRGLKDKGLHPDKHVVANERRA